MPNTAIARDAERDRRAAEALARVERESETVGTSTLPRAGRPVADDDSNEAVVRWGKWIGRGLGFALAFYLLWKVMGMVLIGSGTSQS